MRGRVHARRTLKGLVADLRDYSDKENKDVEKLEEKASSITSEQKDKEEVAL